MQAYRQSLANDSTTGLTAVSQLNGMQQQQQQQQQQQRSSIMSVDNFQGLIRNSYSAVPQQIQNDSFVSSPMLSFVARLTSLNTHELSCLGADPDLVRHFNQTQILLDSKLQDLHARAAPVLTVDDSKHSKLYQNQPRGSLNFANQNQQQTSMQSQNQTQGHQLLLSPGQYYNNYLAQQQLAYSQMIQLQQQQQQQQQLILMASRCNSITNGCFKNIASDRSADHLSASVRNPSSNLDGKVQSQQQTPNVPALDLTTPRPMSAMSATPSPIGSRAGSTGSANNSRQSAPLQHPKKVKLTEYKKMQQLAERGPASCQQGDNNLSFNRETTGTSQEPASTDQIDQNIDQNKRPASDRLSSASKPSGAGKKYRGEFDEPTPDEVSRRERFLNKPGHYHNKALETGHCACIIGSEFRTKTKQESLELLDRWRSLDVETRNKWKWDLNDLPEDIQLNNIKKFEDLRRDFSNGQADFGGASKRKPLGIRGTRQFLLMLYCLWGHPGRDDAMQREGYCPHCFAKIRTDNEQSTLVRVVNHFNMKHRKGANPRLSSPRSESRDSPQLPSPQNHQVRETLISMVESAAEATERAGSDEAPNEQANPDNKANSSPVELSQGSPGQADEAPSK